MYDSITGSAVRIARRRWPFLLAVIVLGALAGSVLASRSPTLTAQQIDNSQFSIDQGQSTSPWNAQQPGQPPPEA